MPACSNCGAHVTRDFIRVFGFHGEVRGCLECESERRLLDGTAAARGESG